LLSVHQWICWIVEFIYIYTAERGKLTPGDVIIISESGILKPEEERIITVSVPSLVSL